MKKLFLAILAGVLLFGCTQPLPDATPTVASVHEPAATVPPTPTLTASVTPAATAMPDDGARPPATEPKPTASVTPLSDTAKEAMEYVKASQDYADLMGREIKLVEEAECGVCPKCWNATFKAYFPVKDITRNWFAFHVSRDCNGSFSGYSMVGVACFVADDCIADRFLVGVKYECVGGKCVKKPFGNPASEKCLEAGGRLEMISKPEGESGLCVFNDSSICDEWAFFRGECKPGQCFKECRAVGSKSEGWYDSCTGELLNWDNCSKSQK